VPNLKSSGVAPAATGVASLLLAVIAAALGLGACADLQPVASENPALDNANMDGSNWAAASVTAVYGAGGQGTPKAQNSAFTP